MTTSADRHDIRARTPGHRGLLLAALVWAAACTDAPTAPLPEGAVDLRQPWVTAEAEAVGLDASALHLADQVAEETPRIRSLLVVRRGRLVHERYWGGPDAATLMDVRSVTKTVVSTLTGIALERGDIQSIDQPITDFLSSPEFDIGAEHSLITIRHLLTMGSGIAWAENTTNEYNEWITSPDPAAYVLARPLENQPGTAFDYNSGAVHLLGILLERATGMSLPDYADEVLFGPLGIEARTWEPVNPPYVNGGAGIDLRPRDLARIGQLFLQDGYSAGTAVVPSVWVEEATQRRWGDLGSSGPIDRLDYGFLWWLDLSHDAYFAWGHGGQFIYVVPGLDLVVVLTTEWRGASQDIGAAALTERAMNVVVNHVLPAVRS